MHFIDLFCNLLTEQKKVLLCVHFYPERNFTFGRTHYGSIPTCRGVVKGLPATAEPAGASACGTVLFQSACFKCGMIDDNETTMWDSDDAFQGLCRKEISFFKGYVGKTRVQRAGRVDDSGNMCQGYARENTHKQ